MAERKAAHHSTATTSESNASLEAVLKPKKQPASKTAVSPPRKTRAPWPVEVDVAQHTAIPVRPRHIVLAPPATAGEAGEGQKEDSDIGRQRASWFFQQRAYPFEHIPEGALQKAIQQRDAMKARQRLAAGSQSAPNGIISFPGDALWHLMGPQPVNNPFGFNGGSPTASGRVTAIAIDPSDAAGNTVYIGGAAGGVWKTTDGGSNWTPLTDFQPSLAVGSIAIDPNNHLTIYVGTGEENFNGDAYYGAGILKSTDGGMTWKQMGASTFAQVLGPQTGGAFIGSVAVQPGNSSIVLAAVSFFVNGTIGGIYRSTDAGVTWTEDASPQGLAATSVFFESTSNAGTTATAWAAMGDPFGQPVNGVYKSTDSGATWTLQTGTGANVLPTANVGRIILGYAPSTSGAGATIYAAIANSSVSSNDLLGLFKTIDGGANWTKLTATPAFCNHQCWYDMAVGVDSGNPSVVVLGGGAGPDNFTSLIESTDGGSTWTGTGANDFNGTQGSVHPHVDTHAVVFTPAGTTLRLYVGNDGGMWRTDNPIQGTVSPTWVDLNAGIASGGTTPGTGLAITQFYPGISAGISDENYGFGGTQDNDIELFSGSFAWTNEFACGDGGFTAIDNKIPTTVYVTCDKLASHVVGKSVFNGAILAGPSSTFTIADTGINHGDRMQFIPPLRIDEGNPNTLYFGTCRLYQTNDGAATWTPITGDLSAGNVATTCPAVGGNPTITTMDVAHQSSGIVVAGTSNSKVWESLNATAGVGSTWTEIDNAQLPNRHITAVRTLRSDATGNVVYATLSGFGSCAGCGGTPGHVFVTTNATSGAPTWTNISGDLPDIPVNDLIVFHQGQPNAYDALYIATDVGVFSCPNPATTMCANWTVIGDGLPNSPVLGLALRRPSRILRAATHGRSMWQIQLTDVGPGPLATITSVTPAAANVGDPATPVTINGFNFSANTAVFFNGVSVGTTTFVSTTQLNVTLASTFFQTGGVFPINLTDPAGVDPNVVLGAASGAPFTVMNPILTATNMTPNNTTAFTPVTLTFTGTNFVSGAGGTLVTFNNIPLPGGTASAGGTSFSVQVTAAFLTVVGPATVTITNPLPGGGPTPAISFAFTINPGTIVFSPNPIVLATFLGTTSAPVMNVAVINTSASPATITAQSITGTNLLNFSFATPTSGTSCNFPPSGQSGTGTITLAANGGTCNFGITYTAANPPGNAASNATLSVTDNAAGSPQTAPIQGTPIPPTVVLLPVNFGAATVGTTSTTMNATLSNFSGSSISVTSAFTVTGTNQADFKIVPFVANGDGNPGCPTTVPFPLASGSSCDVSLTFTPSLPPGNETAQLNVTTSVAVTTINPNLTGIGIEVTSISPAIVATGGPAFTLTVSGGGFASSAVVNVGPNGTNPRLTTFVSANQLQASIPASDIATAGTLPISVTTPNPGGTTSEPKTLLIAQAPPATNDNINFAVNASTTPFRITQDTTQATSNTGGVNDPASSCASNSVARSVWFKFVAPAGGKVVADTRFSSYTTILSAWTGTPGSLVAVAGACASGNVPAAGASPVQSLIGFNVTNGTTYFLMVTDANTSGPGGTLTFSLDFASAAPVNDDFNAATDASAPPFSNTVNSILATTDTGGRADPTPSCAPAGAINSGKANSIWYKYAATANGTVTADTLTSPYETILTVVTGSPGSFAPVTCGANVNAGIAQSQVSFAVASGTTYFIMVSAVLGDGGTTNFHLTFSAVAGPGILFSPTNIAFGNQKVGTSSTTSNITITNNGSATLNITGITLTGTNPGDFTLGAPTSGTACSLGASSLSAGSNCAIGVTFKPTATGARSADVSVADNATGSPQTVPLTGTGTVPVASLSPANIAFGSQTVNTTSATNNVTVSNTGQAAMNITGITLTGTNPGQFALVAPTTGTACPVGASVLNAGSNCMVGVQFAPTVLGAASANVSVADDAAGSPQTVPLTGTGVSAPAPVVTLSPTSISFGNQKVGTTSVAMTATLTNTGNANLNITAVSITGTNASDFHMSGTTCTGTTTLTPTQSCTLGATFTPAAAGARSAAFSITDNAAGSPHSLPLSGTGTVPGVGLAPANIAFGNQVVSTTSATNNITLTNSGNATLNITSITLTGANPGQFTLGSPTTGTACSLGASSLAAGSACSVGVKFAPTATGAFSANVSFADDATGSPQTVGLTGTGTAPAVTFAPTNVPFGNQRTGTSSAVTNVTITNSGTATLNIASITLTGTNLGDFSLGAPTTGTACTLAGGPVTAGSSCGVGVTFKPTATGARSASISVADDASGSPQTVPLTGTGVASAVTFAPTNIAFGNQRTGTSSAITNVIITNSGTAILNITSITLAGTNPSQFALGAPTSGTACVLGVNAIAPGSNCSVGVKFSPTNTGAQSANVSVADDAAGSPQTVPLTGTGTASAATLAPTSVAFGNQVVSTQSAVTNVTITNSGTATLNITGMTLTGTNPGDFSLGAPTTGTACPLGASALSVSSSCNFGVSFGPTATGARSASVSIADDAPGSPQTVALTGTGTAANVTLSPSPVNFANQRINTTSGTTTVTLSNTGNAAVTLAASNAVTITGTNAGDFAIATASGTNCANGLVVAATNGTCVIGVTFTPKATGARTATLQVTDNATPGTQSVTLNGTGTVPTASVTPTTIPFGNQRKGTTSAGTDVTVSNTGTDMLNIASIALTGANPSQFVLGAPSSGTACSLSAPTAVAAGSNCKFSVKFAPTATGAQSASVTITDDSGAVAGSVQTVTLSGTGTLPQASAAPNPLAFGNQRKGTTSAAKTVTLTNTGTDTLNLAAANAVVISGANAADFAIVTATTTCKNGSTVAPNGGTCVINVTFAPTTTNAETATLTITDDSGGVAGATQTVSLTGTGVLPQASPTPATLAFGNQPKGVTSAAMTVTLTNSGTDTLSLAASNAVTISGTNAADFAVVTTTTTCTNGAAIAAGNSCVINITFTPSTTAAESATLTITDDSGGVAGSTQTVSLTGTGVTATVNLAPNPAPFGNQRKGTAGSPVTITLTNSGNGSVTLAASSAVAVSGTNSGDFAVTGGTCANNLVLAAAPGPNNTCTVIITFTPLTAGAETATLTVSFQGSGAPPSATDTLNGTGIFPAVTLTPNTPLAFGNQIITTTSATQTVTLKNTGTDTLNLAAANAAALGGTNAAEFTTTGTTCTNSQAIPVNGTCNIVVAFSPATAGAKSATVTITDDVSPAQVINLSGTGVTPPTAVLSAATLTFAAQRTGTTSSAQSDTLTNNGGADLSIATVVLGGANASDFAIASGTTCTNGSVVRGGAANTCVINVTFTPSAVGARTATITITDNADATGTPGATQTITLNGTGKAPAVTFVPAAVPNFGNQRIGTTSAATTVTITNSGTDTLNFTSITITGTNASDFTVAGSGATPCPTGAGSLAATASCGIAITFKPSIVGARFASVSVADDASGSPQSLALAGTGTAPAVTLSTNAITFPTIAVNSTSAVQSATVKNSGTATLTLGATAVAISGANAGDFAVASGTTCTNGAAIAVSASCTINFTFKPTAPGVRNATATITDDAGGAPGSSTTQTITLTGATPSTATLSAANINFGSQGVNVASSAQTITITNNGGAKLNLAASNAVAISGTNAGDFAIASGSTCTNGASVAGSGGTCVINITFTPGATGARGPATVTITDDAGGVASSTQTATLTGTGIDFTLAATTSTQTVKAGSPATFTLTVAPGSNGFSNAITFTTSTLPRGAKATFNPGSLTPPITTQQTVTLVISTTSRGATPPLPAAPRVPPLVIFRILTVLFAFAALFMMRRGLRTRRLVAYMPLGLLLLALAASAGCIGGNSNGTPAGTTQVTVTATAGSLTHTVSVTLTVQ